mmetsp:Transcript_16265/g.42637  ORF Transcript_16265/g.42637 Transcript_16265/m.42637 type:complete len:158 (+) Transcript_16265:165-638(+)
MDFGGGDDGADYLDYDIKGRQYHEKLFFNSGFAFLAGSVAGTMYGAAEGLRGAASSKVKVRVNAILNGAGKYSAGWGNAMGVVALYYTTVESLASYAELDEYVGGDPNVNHVVAGISTGMLYKCTARPQTMVLAGVLGGGLVGASCLAEYGIMSYRR